MKVKWLFHVTHFWTYGKRKNEYFRGVNVVGKSKQMKGLILEIKIRSAIFHERHDCINESTQCV